MVLSLLFCGELTLMILLPLVYVFIFITLKTVTHIANKQLILIYDYSISVLKVKHCFGKHCINTTNLFFFSS